MRFDLVDIYYHKATYTLRPELLIFAFWLSLFTNTYHQELSDLLDRELEKIDNVLLNFHSYEPVAGPSVVVPAIVPTATTYDMEFTCFLDSGSEISIIGGDADSKMTKLITMHDIRTWIR